MEEKICATCALYTPLASGSYLCLFLDATTPANATCDEWVERTEDNYEKEIKPE